MVWKKKNLGQEMKEQVAKQIADEDEVEEEQEEFEEEEDYDELPELPAPKVAIKKQLPRVERTIEPTWGVGEIPTQTSLVIVNSKTKESYSLYQAIALLLERTE